MLIRQTLLYLPAQVLGPVAQVAAALVWTHWLAPARYGFLTLFIANQELIFLVCQAWWTHFTMRYLATMTGDRAAAFQRSESSLALLCLALQFLATFLVLLATTEHFSLADFAAALAYVLTRSLLTHLGERARARNRIADYSLGQLAGPVLGFALAYVLVARWSPSPWAVLAGFAVGQAGGVAVLLGRQGMSLAKLTPDRTILRAALNYGAPLVLAGAASWLAQNSIRLIVDRFAGASALGLVAVGWGLGLRLAGVLATLVTSASFPLAVQSTERGSKQDGFDQLNAGGILLIGLICPATVGLCFVAVPFTHLFVAQDYRAMTLSTLPLAALTGAIRNIRVHVAEPVFLLVERPRITTVINVIDAVLMSAGCIAGLLAGGLQSAVLGCLVGTLACAVATLLIANRLTGYRFPFLAGGRVAAATGIMASALALTIWLIPAHGSAALRLILEVVIGGATYCGALLVIVPGALDRIRLQLRRNQRVGMGVPLR